MNQNPWFRYALFSFFGALMLMFVSGLVQGGGFEMQAGMMPINNMNMQGMSAQGMMPITAGPMVMNGSVPVSSLAVYPLSGGVMTIMPMGNRIGMANGMMNSGYMAMNNVPARVGMPVGNVAMGVMPMGNVQMNGVTSGMPINMGGM